MGERRNALRVAVRGIAVLYADDGTTVGTIENLSQTGALVSVQGIPSGESLAVELKLGDETSRVAARTVRIDRTRMHVAVEFDHADLAVRAVIQTAIAHAVRAAKRRPVLVIDSLRSRRMALATRLAARGMTPLVPRTPLEAIDLLTRPQLHVNVAILMASSEMHGVLADSFPWVSTAAISDDIDATVQRAVDAWIGTDGARLASAIA